MSTRSRLLLDSAILTVFILAMRPALTGLALHEWLTVAIAAPALLHLIVNWDTVVRWVARSLGDLRSGPRIDLVVDAALFVSVVAVMLSGLLVSQAISSVLGVTLTVDAVWHTVHSVSANLVLLFTLVHTALHWRWFARALGIAPGSTRASTPSLVPVPIVPDHSSPRPRSRD